MEENIPPTPLAKEFAMKSSIRPLFTAALGIALPQIRRI
jgi:hypothetical protein